MSLSDAEAWLDDLYRDLHSAREHLCRAQTTIVDKVGRDRLGVAITQVDLVGSDWCREQWSRFDQPRPSHRLDPDHG